MDTTRILQPASKKISTESFLGVKPEEKKKGGIYVTNKQLRTIQSKVVRIEKILGKENSMLKKQVEITRKQKETGRRKATEEKFEKKPDAKKEAKKSSLSIPKIGFFERVKNFIGKVLLGFLAMKLLPFLPQLLQLLPKIQSVVEWVTDFGIGLLDGLGTFLERAYELRDKTLGFIEDIGGEGAVEAFKKFEKAIEATLTALIAIGGIMAIAAGGSKDGGMGGKGGKKGFDKTGRRVSRSSQVRYFKRFGRDKYIERFGTENLKNLPKSMQRTAVTKGARRAVVGILGKSATKKTLKFVKNFISPVVKRIPIVGAFIDFALNYFVFKDPIGKAAFKAIGSGLGAWFGGLLGTLIPVPFVGTAIGAFVGGVGGDILGGAIYDSLFFNEKLKKTPKEAEDAKKSTQKVNRRGRVIKSPTKTPTTDTKQDKTGGVVVGGPGTPEQKALLDAVSFAEGTTKSYGTIFGGNVIPELERGELTVTQVLEMQRTGKLNGRDVGYGTSYDSDATGRYQFMSYVLKEEVQRQGVPMDAKFTPALQDKLILGRLARFRGVTPELLAKEGLSTNVLDKLAPEFASFPYSPKGNESYYGQPVKTPESIRKAYDNALGRRKEEQKSAQITPVPQQEPPKITPTPTPTTPTPTTDTETSSTADYADDQKGGGSNLANAILKDFPQITTRAHDGQIFASGLGYYLKKVGAGRGPGIGDYGDPPGGDMEHPDHGGVVASHRGAGHSLGVALDLGANSATSGSYVEDQKNLWPHIASYLNKYSLDTEPHVPQVIHGPGESFSPKAGSSFADGAHHNHFHVEFQRAHVGKRTGGMGAGRINGDEFLMNIRNTERILDADTSRALGDTLVQRLDDASTSSGVQKVLSQALGISERASYEESSPSTIIVNQQPTSNDSGYGFGGIKPIAIPLSDTDGNLGDYGEMLAAGQ